MQTDVQTGRHAQKILVVRESARCTAPRSEFAQRDQMIKVTRLAAALFVFLVALLARETQRSNFQAAPKLQPEKRNAMTLLHLFTTPTLDLTNHCWFQLTLNKSGISVRTSRFCSMFESDSTTQRHVFANQTTYNQESSAVSVARMISESFFGGTIERLCVKSHTQASVKLRNFHSSQLQTHRLVVCQNVSEAKKTLHPVHPNGRHRAGTFWSQYLERAFCESFVVTQGPLNC